MDIVHYRCVMDVRAATEGRGFSDLVHQIAAWIRSKEGAGLRLHRSVLMTSGTVHLASRKVAVHVDSLGGEPGVTPDFWALRYEHPDSEFPARRWFTDFGVVRRSHAEWRLSVTVSHSLHHNYLGPEPAAIPVTAPRVVQDLVGSPEWRCLAGETVLTTTPRIVEVGTADAFLKALQDPGRECPLVYLSCAPETGQPLLDSSRLARLIVGDGVVSVAASVETDEELEFLMFPRALRATGGTVRVYAPGVDLNDLSEAARHRYFTRNQIAALTPGEVEAQISKSLTRRLGWVRVRSSVTSIDDVGLRRRESRRAELQNIADARAKAELLKLFEDENVRLEAENAKLASEKASAEEGLEQAQQAIDRLTTTLQRAEYDARFARSDAEQARREANRNRQAAELARGLTRLPRSVEDVLGTIEALHAEHFVVTDRARASARDTSFDDVDAAWQCLHSLATVLPRLAFEQDGPAGTLSERFRHETGGIELTMSEGSQTNRDGRLARLRRVDLNGQVWDISPHVKWGPSFRIHFALDREARRVVIGHCGDHLDTAGTRRRH
jgi:hypothetical protein